MAMTLRNLSVLFRRYVPIESRHPNAWPSDGAKWWPAHEIGHMLTVDPEDIGVSMFGLDDDADPDSLNTFERVCRELSAMFVSHRLLVAAGRKDLALQEREDTDHETMTKSFEPRYRRRMYKILRERGIRQVPTTVSELEARLAAIAPKKITPNDEMMAMGWKRAARITRERRQYAEV